MNSVVQEGRNILELSREVKTNLRRAREYTEEMSQRGRAFYDLMEDRSDLKRQVQQFYEILEQMERTLNLHDQEIESLIE
jgi:hypothetical protein